MERESGALQPSGAQARDGHRAVWLVALLVVAVALGGFWAGRATVGEGRVETDVSSSTLTVTVKREAVGRVLTLNVTAQQPKTLLAANALGGVVTRTAGSVTARQGATLYVVAGIPVRAVQGREPFYRDLAIGVRGQDVIALRAALVAMGHLSAPGEVFDGATYYAVRAWQRALGIEESGTVRLGELVAVPSLPARLVVDSTLAAPGKVLSGGEAIVSGARGTPRFTLVVSEEQARLIPKTATISMRYAGQRWRARIARAQKDDSGDTILVLGALGGGAVCRAQCQLLPAGDTTSILSQVTVVPQTTGPAVPVASVTTAADGSTSVEVVSGEGASTSRPVKVLASQDGMAVVEGVEEGDQVLVFGDGQ